MKILVSPANYQNAIDLINEDIDYLIIGQENFSVRKNYNFSNNELDSLLKNKKNSKVLILINRIFFEEDIKPLTNYLLDLSNKQIDGIIFSDFAIVQIAKENNLKFNFFYNPETLVTNYGQFEFYQKNNINNVIVSRELRLNEINEILVNKQNMKVGMVCCGYSFIMESKWHLIENFNQEYNLDIPLNKKLYLKEELRNFPTIIYQDNFGTYLYSSYCLSALKFLPALKTNNLDYVYIDSFLHDDKWTLNIFKLYKQAANNGDINSLISKEQEICNETINNGFYGSSKDMLYLKEKENE